MKHAIRLNLSIAFAILVLLVSGCGGGGGGGSTSTAQTSPTASPSATASPTPTPTALTVTSTAFANGGSIPVRFASLNVKGGQNVSIPLAWTKVPSATQAFAVLMQDPDANNFTHWLAFNIPPTTTGLVENQSAQGMPSGTIEIRNDGGTVGYFGPEPPSKHQYVITLYALSSPLVGVDQNSTVAQVQAAAQGKILQQASLTGFFTPPAKR